MKQMKIALAAMLAVLMGTTFTSCLDSDNGPMVFYASGTIVDSYPYVYLKGDDGVNYEISNPSVMQFGNSDGGILYPKRAMIAYNQIEGEDYTTNKTNYKVSFISYVESFFGGGMSGSEVESMTPLYLLQAAGEIDNDINVLFSCYYKGTVEGVNSITDGIKMYPYKWENNKLYFKLVHAVEVDKNAVIKLGMCFPLPSKSFLQSRFNEIEFTGSTNDTIDIVVTADVDDQEFSLKEFKAKVRY